MAPSPTTNQVLAESEEESVNSQVDDSVGSSSDPDKTGSSWRSSTGTTSKEGESSEEKLSLARKETTAVFRLRLLVFCVLLLAAGKSALLCSFCSKGDSFLLHYVIANKSLFIMTALFPCFRLFTTNSCCLCDCLLHHSKLRV